MNERQENYKNWIFFIASGYCFAPAGVIVLNLITDAKFVNSNQIGSASFLVIVGLILLRIIYNRLEEK